MELLESIGSWAGYIAIALFFIFKNGAQKYVDEKAKNLATIEDTGKITNEVENVKSQFHRQSHAWKWVFEKEYEILKDVWNSSWEFQAAARSLRPMMDFVPEDDEEKKKMFEDRYKTYIDSANEFKDVVYKNKPFIPPVVYETCLSLKDIVSDFQIDFELSYIQKLRGPDWKRLTESVEKLNSTLDELNDNIREHVHGNLNAAQPEP
ncbi:hypothetical protein PDESU_00385 [Pontiella desulfatans]|uniref:Chromosome partition protein Smc n=2 Tax=Pontiella desulfatans TaxID=2750659 RepID=A0A6C2TVZ6_PONDE|nr:hypothetical protein PDESU_00385 [Pontiella desulfatans]